MWLSSVVPTFRRFSRRDDTFHQREIRPPYRGTLGEELVSQDVLTAGTIC